VEDISQVLGRIEGKLDQVIEAAREHRDDDKRRFTEVYGTLEKHAEDINQAKGAKGVIVWLASGVAAAAAALVTYALKVFGVHQ